MALIWILLGAVIGSVGGFVMLTLFRGVCLYRDVLRQCSLKERIEALRKQVTFTPLHEISPLLILVVLLSEDVNFFVHRGIDLRRMFAAAWLDLRRCKLVTGGSCITQQLAKNLCFSFRKTFSRKVAELFVVWQLERQYSKLELLEMYLNVAYLGDTYYGVEAASQHYFHCTSIDLTLEQCLSLAITFPSPRWRNPFADKHNWEKFYHLLRSKYEAIVRFPLCESLEALQKYAQAHIEACCTERKPIGVPTASLRASQQTIRQ